MNENISNNKLIKSRTSQKIDFVIVGPQKTGSTSLSHIFNANSQIKLPKEEIPVFEDPNYFKIKNIDLYLKRLFKKDKKKILGIKRPNYFNKKYVPQRLFEYNKKIKIIITIRDPYERFLSHYLHQVSCGLLPLFKIKKNIYKLLDKNSKFLEQYPKSNEVIDSQNYWENYQNFKKFFPQKNILILDVRDINKKSTQEKINNFLGIQLNYSFTKVNIGSYDYVSIFLRSLIHKIKLNKDKNQRLHKRKELSYLEKRLINFLNLLLRINFFKPKIKIPPQLKEDIQSRYKDNYQKIYSLKI